MAKTIKTARKASRKAKDNRTVRFTVTCQMDDYDQTEYATLAAARKAAYNPKLVAPETYAVIEWHRKPGGTRWLRTAVHAIREDLDRKFRKAWKGIADGRGRTFLDLYAAPKKEKASGPKKIALAEATNNQIATCCKSMGFDEVRSLEKFVYGDPRTEVYTPAIRKGALAALKKFGVTHAEVEGVGLLSYTSPIIPRR